MQRPNNAGGPGGGLWTTADVGGTSASTYTGQNRNLQHPAASQYTGRDGIMPVIRCPINPQQPNPLNYRPWGQPDQDAMAQQSAAAAAALWNHSNSSRSTDQTRSLLGTEQWGRESGGAPWGSSPHLEQTAVAETSSVITRGAETGDMFRNRVTSDPWLVGNSSVLQSTPEKNTNQTVDDLATPKESVGDQNPITEDKRSSPSDLIPSSRADSGASEKDQNPETGKSSPTSEPAIASDAKADSVEEKPEQPAADENATGVASAASQEEPAAASSTDGDPQASAASDPAAASSPAEVITASSDPSISGATDQLQQMNLVDYQQALTAYQLMQHQYAQLTTPGGMLFPGSYIIPAQANPAAYSDPAAAGQFPVVAHYSPYAGWPAAAAAGMYPAMLQQQMAAVAASVSSQQAGSSASSQSNRATAQATQSPSQSPSLQQQQQQESSQPNDLLANAAAASNLNQAMAMAGYGIMPSAYYDQTGAFIVNNGRGTAPVRFFASGPMLMNGSQPWISSQVTGNGSMFRYNPVAQQQAAAANAMYANQPPMSGGSTPAPSLNQGFNPMQSGNFGSSGNISNLGVGPLSSGIGSNSSTPQRKDSFSEYNKIPQSYSGMSHFYNSLGVSPGGRSNVGLGPMSPSPGPLSSLMNQGHHGLHSPPPSMSPSNMMHGSGNSVFQAAPGAEAKYRNGQYVPSIGNSGSSLFPPTRIRPHLKEMIPHGRSKLLDDFRNNRLTNPMLHELANHIVEFSQDQHGSRFIQQKLERATPSEKQQVFNEIIDSAHHLMTDVFGNYVIQKFFEFGSQDHKLALADCIHGHVLPLALQMYGCRVIQKALECIPPEKQVDIVQELDGHLLKCVKDQNGNHVVQKCIECVPPAHLQFIVDGFKGQVVVLSSHPYGCRVMQRILEHCTDDQTAPILDELHQHTEMLVKDQYGNYVIQHVLEHGHPEHKNQVVNELRGKILALSQHKFASNVIEKCVSHSSPANRAWLIDEVCQEPDALFIMMKDQYANYVVQKMLDVAEPQQKKLLIHKIRPHVLTLRKFTYGKHIITKLEKFFQKSTAGSAPGAASSSGDLAPSQLGAANWGLDASE